MQHTSGDSGFFRISLGEVVPDVAEDVLDLAAQEDHATITAMAMTAMMSAYSTKP